MEDVRTDLRFYIQSKKATFYLKIYTAGHTKSAGQNPYPAVSRSCSRARRSHAVLHAVLRRDQQHRTNPNRGKSGRIVGRHRIFSQVDVLWADLENGENPEDVLLGSFAGFAT